MECQLFAGCKPRSKDWWKQAIRGAYGEKWWLDNLRLSRRTFELLCTELNPYLQRKNTNLRLEVSVEAKVAVTLWRLATNSEYHTIAELFELRRSTVEEIVWDTYEVIVHHLLHHYLYMPQSDRLH